jgi:hypothetical protein
VNNASPTVLVPPRPNLGPEPLPEGPPLAPLLSVLGLVLFLSAALLWRLRKRRRKRPASKPAVMAVDAFDDSPQARMIAWSLAVRESLSERFGPAWRAKTTEEIADDPSLIDALGPEFAARILYFLREADRTKFAGASAPVVEPDFEEIAARIRGVALAAGASSMINGK